MTTIIRQCKSLAQLRESLATQPHRRTDRGLFPDDIDELERALPTAKRRVRRYSGSGFVPNAYGWPCHIWYAEAVRDEESGEWTFVLGRCSAQRSFGAAPLTVVQ